MGRLVDRNYLPVFVNDFKLDVLWGRELRRSFWFNHSSTSSALFEATRRFCRVAVNKHRSSPYQFCGAGAAQTSALAGEPFVDPAARVCFGDDDGNASRPRRRSEAPGFVVRRPTP